MKIQCAINGCDGIAFYMVHLQKDDWIPYILVCNEHYRDLGKYLDVYPKSEA